MAQFSRVWLGGRTAGCRRLTQCGTLGHVPSSLAFYNARIAALDLQIAAYEAAILAFATSGAAQEYAYNTGQDSIRVERADANVLQATLDSMINQREIYCVRTRQSRGSHTSRGAW